MGNTMPPKGGFDPDAITLIYMKVVGGEPAAQASLAPKISPLGMKPKEVGDDNRKATVTVMPNAAPLILKALKEPPRDRKKTKDMGHNGNLKMDDILKIAKEMRSKSYAAEYVGTVKEILGTYVSIGCTVSDNEGNKCSPNDIQAKIDSGDIQVNE